MRSPVTQEGLISVAVRPHLGSPDKWALCEDGSCNACSENRRARGTNIVVQSAACIFAVGYALAAACWFPQGSPLLLLVLLTLPAVILTKSRRSGGMMAGTSMRRCATCQPITRSSQKRFELTASIVSNSSRTS